MDRAASHQAVDPRRYFESVETASDVPEHEPVCLYLETTNRCNLLCTTCPRTYEELEPPADMSWELFTSIVDQIKRLPRAVLHGVGEPMLVKNLPRMVRYLKDRGTYVLFNTNGTVLNERNGRALIAAELGRAARLLRRGERRILSRHSRQEFFQPYFEERARLPRTAGARGSPQAARVGLAHRLAARRSRSCRTSCSLAAETGIKEVHLQRLVFFKENAIGMARPDQALYEQLSGEEAAHIDRAALLAKSLGITFSASGGASEPGMSLKRSDNGTPESGSPWSLCRRPWTVMYFTANGRALPCCIAPFSQRGYENYTLGDATQQTLREIWTGPAYRDFRKALKSDKPSAACASCGLRWSL